MKLSDRTPAAIGRCREARELLPAFVEDELEADKLDRLSLHLKSCADCRFQEAQYRRALGVLDSPAVRAPEFVGDLYPGFLAKLEARRPAIHRTPRLQWAAALACLVLVVAVGAAPLRHWLATRSHGNERAPTPSVMATGIPNLLPPRGVPGSEIPNGVGPNISKQPNRFVEKAVPDHVDVDSTIQQSDESVDNNQRGSKRVASMDRRNGQPRSFLDVRAADGSNARDLIARISKRSDGAAPGEQAITPKDLRPSNDLVAVREERVQVGEKVTQVKTGYETDSAGRRTGIHVEIGTFMASPEGDNND